jgi:hypothetical protein
MPREHDPDWIGQQTPSYEGECQRRRVVQPLGVIDDTQQRTLIGSFGDQAQHRQPNEERIRDGADAQTEQISRA